jgi:hypothetical protein
MKILSISSTVDFDNEIIVNDEWRKLMTGGVIKLFFDDATVLEFGHMSGLLFDYASIPNIPFFKHWRFSKDLHIASYCHDLIFIHQFKDYKYGADVMNAIMKCCGVNPIKRNIIYRSVKSNIAKHKFTQRNKYDGLNESLSYIKEY